MTNIYGFHITDKNTCLDKDNPHISFGRAKMGNLSNAKTKEELDAIYAKVYPDRLNAKGNYVGQLNLFVNETKEDDIIIYRVNRTKDIYIGRITSKYYFKENNIDEDDDYKHIRNVKWIKCVDINCFSKEFLNSLAAQKAYFSMNKYKDIIEDILNNDHPSVKNNFTKLKEANDIDKDKYDGSYLLVRKIVEAYKNVDENLLDTKDIDIIYFATIGTWANSFQNKKHKIKLSHLPIIKQNELISLIDKLETDTKSGVYSHREANNYVFGMFGTGCGTLNISADNTKKLIKLFIKVNDSKTFDECIPLLRDTLLTKIHNCGTATISQILHCIKPTFFPILNSAVIKNKAYEMLGIDIIDPNDITTYVDNTLKIQKFRDDNFTFKNYRVFDLALASYDVKPKELKTIEAYTNAQGFWTCDTGLTKDDWVNILNDKNITNRDILDIIIAIYNSPKHTTSCYQLAKDFNNDMTDKYFNGKITKYCQKVLEQYNLKIHTSDGNNFIYVLVDGKQLEYYNWMLKEEVVKALEQLNLFNSNTIIPNSQEFIPRQNKLHHLNNILYGAPGTGKTYATAYYALAFINGKSIDDINKEYSNREKIMNEYKKLVAKGQIVFTTFHQNYSYEDFIQGLRPVKNESFKFEYHDGIFKKIVDIALTDSINNYVIIIDEINRANISKVFGELITLIEEDKRCGEKNAISVVLPSGDEFKIPNNLYILGTMNSADKSISLIDAALRRRFNFIEISPNAELIKEQPVLKEVLINLNENLYKELKSTDLLIGHSYFIDKTEADLLDILNNNIIPLLYEYFFDNVSKVKDLLNNSINKAKYKVEESNIHRIKVTLNNVEGNNE